MSTSQREVAATPLNARVPLASIITGQVRYISVLCVRLKTVQLNKKK